jgi:predicted 3-demethylubiquinone-9 3-methyltransferase (glyoxalase superfamily)
MKRDIFPCLWFDNVAKEAADFYCSAFGNANITSENPIVVELEIFGQKFTCLNGGTKFQCNPSISFFVIFETAKEL